MTTDLERRRERVDACFDDRNLLEDFAYEEAVLDTLGDLNRGRLRVASPAGDGSWRVETWIQKAVALYFVVASMQDGTDDLLPWHDRVPLKRNFVETGVRVVPGATVRYGSYLERGVVVMPAFINIGAFVGEGTMVDTWATVGSCAQVGKGVHVSGGVGIGGVLEPVGARPVIVEDHAFLGSRSILVEGVHVGEGAVLGANVVLTASTAILDVRGSEARVTKGYVPPRSVVIPGTRPKRFPAGEFDLPCALIIGERSASTDEKTSLNETLRSFAL